MPQIFKLYIHKTIIKHMEYIAYIQKYIRYMTPLHWKYFWKHEIEVSDKPHQIRQLQSEILLDPRKRIYLA